MSLRVLAFSFLGHALIFVLIFLDQKSSETIRNEIVEVEFKDIIQKKNTINNKYTGRKLIQKNFLLFPKMDAMSLLSKVENNNKISDDFGVKKQSSYFSDAKTYDADINEVFGENGNQNWSHYKEIYKRIDSNLLFDSILAQYSHFGRVFVQFKVTADGLFKLDDLAIEADDSILKVHVLRAIEKSLILPIEPAKKLKFSEYTLFKAEFNFRYGSYKNNFYKQNNFGKPVFVFNRATEEKPINKELLSYLLADGVMDNPFLLAERLKKYNKKKHLAAVEFDPFENYKRDFFYSM